MTAKPPTKRNIQKEQLLSSAQLPLVSLLAYWLGYNFTVLFFDSAPQIGGIWSAISAVYVLQASYKESKKTATTRVMGTAIGSAISAIYLSFLPFHVLGLGATVYAAGLICIALKMPSWMKLSANTVLVVMVTTAVDPEMNAALNALLRFVESLIGTAIAVVVAALWPLL